MDTKSKVGISLALAGLVTFLIFMLVNAPTPTPATPNASPTPPPNVGGLAGPNIPSLYLQWGLGLGSQVYPVRSQLTSGTTTPFSAQSPAATSTIESFACTVTAGTSTAQTLTLSKGVTQQASTTALSNSISVAAGAQGEVIASSTPDSTRIIAPNNWVQFNSKGGVGTSNQDGFCTVVFRLI